MHSQFLTFIITSASHHPKIIMIRKNIIESISKTGRILKIENRSHDLIYVAFINEMSEQDPAKNHFLDLLENNGSGSFAFSNCSFGLVFCRWCRQKVIYQIKDIRLEFKDTLNIIEFKCRHPYCK